MTEEFRGQVTKTFLPNDRCIIEYPLDAGEATLMLPKRLSKVDVERICAVLRTLQKEEGQVYQ